LSSSQFVRYPRVWLPNFETNFRHWKVQSIMFRGADISVIEICRRGDLSLQFNCGARDTEEFSGVIDSFASELHDEFTRVVGKVRKFEGALERFVRPLAAACRDGTPSGVGWEAVRKELVEVFFVRPNFAGIGVDLKQVWKLFRQKLR
jgi:hypothetical protein